MDSQQDIAMKDKLVVDNEITVLYSYRSKYFYKLYIANKNRRRILHTYIHVCIHNRMCISIYLTVRWIYVLTFCSWLASYINLCCNKHDSFAILVTRIEGEI